MHCPGGPALQHVVLNMPLPVHTDREDGRRQGRQKSSSVGSDQIKLSSEASRGDAQRALCVCVCV